MTNASAAVPRSVSLVIVNWNSGALLGRCVESVQACLDRRRADAEIIVVDNGSTDRSLDACIAQAGLRVLRNGRNLGFGRACNVGARASVGDVVLFVNPDCEVRAGSIERCLDELGRDDVGVCGVALLDEHGRVARTCHRFPTVASFVFRILGLHLVSTRFGDGAMTDWDHSSDADVDHVIGAFYAMRRNVFERLGGFDERFFVYLEDLDLSLRVRESGLRVRFLAGPPSMHLGGGVSRQAKAARLFYATRSRVLYAYKHFPRWQARMHLVLSLLVEPLTRAALSLAKRSPRGLVETGRAFAMLWRNLPATLRLARPR